MTIQPFKNLTAVLFASAVISFAPSHAQAADDGLEQRVRLLEQQLEQIKLAHAAAPASNAVKQPQKEYPKVQLFGYTQFTGTFGSGTTPHQFGFDRVRLGAKGDITEHIGYRVMVELLKLDKPAKANTTVEGLLDVMLTYRVAQALKISAGQFKAPFSMAYNISAAKLDVIGFGMATNVALDRGLGVMASGRNLAESGIGYDIGVFNAGTRADGTAFTAGTLGRDDMVVGRLLFDGFGKRMHLEGGAAKSTVKNGAAYTAAYAGLKLRYDPLELAGEWLRGRQGTRRTTVFYGQLLARFLEHFELVGKWERTHLTDVGVNLTADNLIVGLNAALDPERPQRARLQLNYVVVGRNAASLGRLVGFKKGYRDNQFKAMIQAGF